MNGHCVTYCYVSDGNRCLTSCTRQILVEVWNKSGTHLIQRSAWCCLKRWLLLAQSSCTPKNNKKYLRFHRMNKNHQKSMTHLWAAMSHCQQHLVRHSTPSSRCGRLWTTRWSLAQRLDPVLEKCGWWCHEPFIKSITCGIDPQQD